LPRLVFQTIGYRGEAPQRRQAGADGLTFSPLYPHKTWTDLI